MFLWLLRQVSFLRDNFTSRTEGDSALFLTGRIAGASVTAFVAAIILGPIVISWLKKHFRERIASASDTLNQLHAEKENTPTMGGVLIVLSLDLSALIWAQWNSFVLLTLLSLIVLSALGFYDDYLKVT